MRIGRVGKLTSVAAEIIEYKIDKPMQNLGKIIRKVLENRKPTTHSRLIGVCLCSDVSVDYMRAGCGCSYKRSGPVEDKNRASPSADPLLNTHIQGHSTYTIYSLQVLSLSLQPSF